jgi:predicted glycosyltransferase
LKLLIEFSHPAQVHKFKHVITALQNQGVDILILSRDKDVMLELLDELNVQHQCISRARSGLLGSMLELLLREWRVFIHVLRFRPDMLFSAHSVAITHIGWLLRIPRLVHEDTEFGSLQQKLYMPFANRIITSTAYYLDWGKRQVRIPSLEPLAYLHPKYFTPNPARLMPYGLSENTRYAVIRVVAWKAMHDRGLKGMIMCNLEDVITQLRALGFEKIVLSAEVEAGMKLPDSIIVPRTRDLHHLLAFSSLCLSESITVAGESAVLGTPTLLLNPLRAGHSLELQKYGLLERCDNLEKAMCRATEISRDKNITAQWRQARCQLLQEKSDMTKALTDIILSSADHLP